MCRCLRCCCYKMNHKTIVMLAGLPGTGKSTLAMSLSTELDWPIIDKDLIHSALITSGQNKDESGSAAYEAGFWLVKDFVMRQNRSVVFDSAGRQKFILTRLQDVCSESQAILKIIHCSATRTVRQDRLAGRAKLGSQLAADVFSDDEEQVFYAHLPACQLYVDTTAGVSSILSRCLDYLRVRP